jgi:hypothetical protein
MAEGASRLGKYLAQLQESGQTQLSRTDPDARLVTKTGQSVSGYNVQIAVDAAHKATPSPTMRARMPIAARPANCWRRCAAAGRT